MTAMQEAVERLERATWDSRVIPRKADIRTVLDALSVARAIAAQGGEQ